VSQELRGHVADHESLGPEPGGAGSICAQPPARRRARSVCLLLAHDLTGRSPLLRRTPSTWQDPPPSSAPTRQQMGRHPPHLSSASRALRRRNRLATSRIGRSLTRYGPGVSSVTRLTRCSIRSAS